jgi:hypothetical protein
LLGCSRVEGQLRELSRRLMPSRLSPQRRLWSRKPRAALRVRDEPQGELRSRRRAVQVDAVEAALGHDAPRVLGAHLEPGGMVSTLVRGSWTWPVRSTTRPVPLRWSTPRRGAHSGKRHAGRECTEPIAGSQTLRLRICSGGFSFHSARGAPFAGPS